MWNNEKAREYLKQCCINVEKIWRSNTLLNLDNNLGNTLKY